MGVPPLDDLLLPYISPPHPPLCLFLHPHPTVQPLLSSHLPSLIASSGARRVAHVDAVEFGATPRGLMEEVQRQWGGDRDAHVEKWTGWGDFLRALEKDAVGEEDGRLLVLEKVESLRGGMGFGPGGLGGLLIRLSEMVSTPRSDPAFDGLTSCLTRPDDGLLCDRRARLFGPLGFDPTPAIHFP